MVIKNPQDHIKNWTRPPPPTNRDSPPQEICHAPDNEMRVNHVALLTVSWMMMSSAVDLPAGVITTMTDAQLVAFGCVECPDVRRPYNAPMVKSAMCNCTGPWLWAGAYLQSSYLVGAFAKKEDMCTPGANLGRPNAYLTNGPGIFEINADLNLQYNVLRWFFGGFPTRGLTQTPVHPRNGQMPVYNNMIEKRIWNCPSTVPVPATKQPTKIPTTYPPTEAPTTSPPFGPTPPPTGSPTPRPTPPPTGSPTSGPTPPPKGSPTSRPTPPPTGSPTSGPTPPPTASRPTTPPTQRPTTRPTLSSTSGPTKKICPKGTKPIYIAQIKQTVCKRYEDKLIQRNLQLIYS